MATTNDNVTHLNIGCGTWHADAPWWNIDVVENDEIHPDQVVPRGVPLSYIFGMGTLERVYMGHVIEHIPWLDLPAFLEDVHAMLKPGGEAMVVGPDVLKVIEAYRAGTQPMWLVKDCLEHWDRAAEGNDWDEAVHKWNCHEDRVAIAMRDAGFTKVTVMDIDQWSDFEGWAIDGRFAPWQCAVRGLTPL